MDSMNRRQSACKSLNFFHLACWRVRADALFSSQDDLLAIVEKHLEGA
jgi:hypothetical protein